MLTIAPIIDPLDVESIGGSTVLMNMENIVITGLGTLGSNVGPPISSDILSPIITLNSESIPKGLDNVKDGKMVEQHVIACWDDLLMPRRKYYH